MVHAMVRELDNAELLTAETSAGPYQLKHWALYSPWANEVGRLARTFLCPSPETFQVAEVYSTCDILYCHVLMDYSGCMLCIRRSSDFAVLGLVMAPIDRAFWHVVFTRVSGMV